MKLKPHFQKIATMALVLVGLRPALAFAAGTPKPQHERGTAIQ